MQNAMESEMASPVDNPFRFVFSDGFAELLEGLGVCLLVTTYQAGKLMAVRARGGRVIFPRESGRSVS